MSLNHVLQQDQQQNPLKLVEAGPDYLLKMARDTHTDNLSIYRDILRHNETKSGVKLVSKSLELIQCFRDCITLSCNSDVKHHLEGMFEYFGFMLFQAINQNNLEALDKVGDQLNQLQQFLDPASKDAPSSVSAVGPSNLGLQKSTPTHI